ncbi:MAG: amidophosphoribosyltransferase [Defluviitaleaceae bacterium]|nr:amidophosphoribosyltransferase [Defluviitaleaceae bacterium]
MSFEGKLFERKINEECGLFGIWGHAESSRLTYYGLHSLQHRGQDGAGIVAKIGDELIRSRGKGLLTEALTKDMLADMKGTTSAIGHVLYSTRETKSSAAIQPLLFHFEKSSLAICHNGALVNATSLRSKLEEYGSIFQTVCVSEILAHIIKRSRLVTFLDSVKRALSQVHGGFAFLLMTQSGMYAARDSRGLRPLVIGKLGDSFVVASETCALDTVGAKYVRDVAPGEIVTINDDGLKSDFFTSDRSLHVCGMEYIYIARPDSDIEGVNVHTSRKNAGRILARESPTEADVVIGSPDTGISAAIGYAEAMGIPYELGLIRNRYVGRTFIAPEQSLREMGVKMKLSAVHSIVEGKSVVLVEDSIVRGTTVRHIIKLLRDAGAREVHMKIASPLYKYPCYYGIDTPSPRELIAHKRSAKAITKEIGADSLEFISEEGLVEAVGRDLCLACYNGDYPTHLQDFAGIEER